MERSIAGGSSARRSGSGSSKHSPQILDYRKVNPVLVAFEQELSHFVKYMRQRAECGARWKKSDDEPVARGSNILFLLWNSYEARLPRDYYLDKLLSTGDFLYSIKEFKLAQFHCYGRFLSRHTGKGVKLLSVADCQMGGFTEIYLPAGLADPSAVNVLRAVLGETICSYHSKAAQDSKLQNQDTVSYCVDVLKILRLATQTALHKEDFSWLVFNGTVHIYSVSRHLMAFGHSSKALEFLLWACMSMESSIPLLTVRYLVWRSTLYTAVCQCYFDIRATAQSESFARRGLAKITELDDIEKISTSERTPDSEAAFRQAKTKMQVMIFRRVVFETRKRPKGLLRPKTKANLKDSINQAWPRTPTERLLADLLHGTSAQFLAVLESLSEPHRRTLHCEAPSADSDDTVADVCGELFFAGLELVAGGGGARQQHALKHESEIHPSITSMKSTSLIDLISKGENGVPLSSLCKFVKLAFGYEQWETFDTLVEGTLELLREQSDVRSLNDMKALELMLAMEPFFSGNKRIKKGVSSTDSGGEGATQGQAPKTHILVEELAHLAEVIYSCSQEPYRSAIAAMDNDMMVDASLFLWSKCKVHFQRVMSSSSESCKQLLNDPFSNKWLFILSVVHNAISWSGAASFDPVLSGEVTLKLALVFEARASASGQIRSGSSELGVHAGAEIHEPKETTEEKAVIEAADEGHVAERPHSSSTLSTKYGAVGIGSLAADSGVRELFTRSSDVLRQGIQDICQARNSIIDASGQCVADVAWLKPPSGTKADLGSSGEQPGKSASVVQSMVEALHMELLFVYHRVAVKLASLGKDSEPKKASKKSKIDKSGAVNSTELFTKAENDLLSQNNRNPLSKALLLMNTAAHSASLKSLVGSQQQIQLLQDSLDLIQKAQQQERKLTNWNRPSKTSKESSFSVPPAPVLLYRSSSLMVLQPAPFVPKNGEKVAWYRLFGRSASGNNVKVRLNDYQLLGTGEETPATENCHFHVQGLNADEKYMFAIAAYNSGGQLIGGSIGTATRPILASHPLPTLVAWGYLAQVAYTTGVLSVAKSATSVLWNHFVLEVDVSKDEADIQTAERDLKITLKRLNEARLLESSPVLSRLFLQSIFIAVDIKSREGFLYCDSLSDSGSLYSGQVSRLMECERLLLAIQVAGWLNDSAMCLQAAVQCYGLLAPMVHCRIPSRPLIQVLLRCHAVLQEVPSLTRHRKQISTSDSLSHMIATMTYYIGKVLQMWNEQGVAGAIIELGKKMLNLDTAPDNSVSMTSLHVAAAMATSNQGGLPPTKKTTKKREVTKKTKGGKGGGGKGMEKEQGVSNDGQSEELKALEAYIMKLSQQALNREDEELTGSEDPSILNSFVANLPAEQAYKEVLKFKRRTRFLSFYVQVLQKALQEGLTEVALEWTNDTMSWLLRRNELLLTNKPTIVRQGTTAGGLEDEKMKKFATAIVEFGKPPTRVGQQKAPKRGETRERENEIQVRLKQETAKPLSRKKSQVISRRTRRFKGKTSEELDFYKAIDRLQTILPDFWRSSQRKRKLRAVCDEELPWRAQMNILLCGANFEVFLDKLDNTQPLTNAGDPDGPLFRSSCMDPEWFSLATSGTLIVTWSGTSRRGSPDLQTGVMSGSVVDTSASPSVAGTDKLFQPRQPHVTVQGEGARTGTRVTVVPPSERARSTPSKSHVAFLESAIAHLSQAIVLAHRGKYWTLLQNACRTLWNMSQAVLMRVAARNLHLAEDGLTEEGTNIDVLRNMLWRPFYWAADCLMDMMVHTQSQAKLDSEYNKKRGKVKDGDLEITEQSGLLGGVEDERGGSSLIFESPLDNTCLLDTRWLKKFILYATEMLFYENKWERTVDIILRFNALTRSRFAESLLPLLIVAQRNLRERIEAHGGHLGSQPVISVSKETGVAEQFLIQPVDYPFIEPAVHIDPEGHDVYSGSSDALRLVSVPVNINDSLAALHQALDLKHHTARALEHSRQLLLCYLAGQREGGSSDRLRRGSSRVGFVANQVKPPSDVPVDLMDELFESVEDVQSYTLQPAQLAVVIASYDKTIQMLQYRQQKGLAAQAMHELGNVMFHSGNIRAAYKWWVEALDTILNTKDCLHTWRDVITGQRNPEAALLARCGLWGCLLGGVLAANIAQYIHTSNLGLRLEGCHLSAALFKALFCSSLPHPSADKDYALYEIGSGSEVPELVPGIDLLSENFRCDGRSVVSALRWLTEELSRARHLTVVLPLLTLCLYFTTHVCRDLQRSVDVRILKVRVLTDLAMFSEAISVLMDLLHGRRLPRQAMQSYKMVESKSKLPEFRNNKPLTDPDNLKVLNDLLERRLLPSLSVLYGPQLAGQLAIAHVHLMITMAATVYAIPVDVGEELQHHLRAKEEMEECPTPKSVHPPPPPVGKKIGKKKPCEDAVSVKSSQTTEKKILIESKGATPEVLKGFLLSTGELILVNLCESFTDASEQNSWADESFTLGPAELELLCLARLELAQAAAQRHHAVTSGSLVYSAMRALEDAAILNELEMEKRPNSFIMSSARKSTQNPPANWGGNHYLSCQARCRLDARLWLNCRLALAKGLMEEDSGIGKLGGSARSVTAAIGSCLHHCQQGLDEAEAFGDLELMAEFLFLIVLQTLQQGKINDELLDKLQDVISKLGQVESLSFSGQHLLALAIIQYADLQGSRDSCGISYLVDPETAYNKAASVLLDQMMLLGERISFSQMAPVQPVGNIYLVQLVHLVEIKLRLGRTLARKSNPTAPTWTEALRELERGLELAKTAAFSRKPLEAHLLFSLGQIQRQLFELGEVGLDVPVNSLVGAVMCAFTSDHDLGLMRQAYLEIGLAYLSKVKTLKAQRPTRSPATPDRTLLSRESKKLSRKELSLKEKERKEREMQAKEHNKELEKQLKATWAAIRAAGVVSMAQYRLGLLSGDQEITALKISEKSGRSLPDFALFDLLGTDDVITSVDSDTHVAKDGVVTMGTSVNNSNRVQITWLHVLGYLSVLRRQCSYSALGVSWEGEDAVRFENVVLTPLFSSNKALKLANLHSFLRTELSAYAQECCGVYPPEAVLQSGPSGGPPMLVTQPTQKDLPEIQDTEKEETEQDPLRTADKAANAAEFEMCVQWYRPDLQPVPDASAAESEQQTQEDTTLFLYAFNNKAVNSSPTSATVKAGCCSVLADSFQVLHEELVETLEMAESDLKPVSSQSNQGASRVLRAESQLLNVAGGQETKLSSQQSLGGRKKRSVGIRALSAKQKKDDRIRVRLKAHLEKICSLLHRDQVDSIVEIPFGVTLQNVTCMEAMFDPTRGSIGKTNEAYFNWLSNLVED